ncbi:hypothetical protein OOZ19_19235 [Saccharopolyspora sp. NFXS83]|uniref:hypothetical protein n=1 Tax=Saccharopolyspora sp. NFXS83 TaxID=2993560 RepID=UPI00224AC094|nr:hypothetical protein [Saccharopolyspora sp. NFXS83]MCX2732378.1 hypothetical protein [Saccharopolyspora sp. NFXS83]
MRQYEDDAEFTGHADGKTDYLGTLPKPGEGTWVRFSPTGTNVLGENHAEVTFDHVITAVGSSSFVYEAFASDDLSAFPSMNKAYEKSAEPMRKKFGVPKQDLSKHGGESIFPKLAQALNILYTRLEERNVGILDDRMGEILQRSLKLAWKYGKDLGQEPGSDMAPERKRFIAVHQDEKGLEKFVKGLKDGRSIADAKGLAEHREALMAYIKAFINDIWAAGGE